MAKVTWKFKIVKGFQSLLSKLTIYLRLREVVQVLIFGALARAIILKFYDFKNQENLATAVYRSPNKGGEISAYV